VMLLAFFITCLVLLLALVFLIDNFIIVTF
jgi:hypothetical protein